MHRYPTRFQVKKRTLTDERLRDINVIKELLAKSASSPCRVDKMETVIQLFEYLITHPFLIQNHASFREVISQKIAEFERNIRDERQSLKREYVNRSIAEWREMAQILGLMDVIEELSCRVKTLYL
jgi:predicted Ser/Thr protein kinase